MTEKKASLPTRASLPAAALFVKLSTLAQLLSIPIPCITTRLICKQAELTMAIWAAADTAPSAVVHCADPLTSRGKRPTVQPVLFSALLAGSDGHSVALTPIQLTQLSAQPLRTVCGGDKARCHRSAGAICWLAAAAASCTFPRLARRADASACVLA